MKNGQVEVFEGEENYQRYVDWVRLNTQGFVANSTPREKQVREGKDPKIHRASCERWIIKYLKPSDHPTKSYRKICSNDLGKLKEKLKELNLYGFSPCEKCKPY